MSLFGGLDLGSPAERNELILRRELELRREREPASGWGRVYRNGADLLLTHGEFFEGRELPERYAQYAADGQGRCYWDAAACAEAEGVRYFEGVASASGGRFLSHGFCVDPDGIIDLTWWQVNSSRDTGLPTMRKEHWSYFGVEIHPELMRAHEDIGFPMLGRDPIEKDRQRMPGQPEWFTGYGLDLTPPEKLPLLDYPYKPDRREFA